jgi:hypothetical protein
VNSLPPRPVLLERAALRAANEPLMLASLFREVCGDGSFLDLDSVARALVCDRDRVVKAALCRRPDSRSSSFCNDVKAIANSAQIDGTRLLAVIREADSIAAFRASSGLQMLAAARDFRDDDNKSGQEDT